MADQLLSEDDYINLLELRFSNPCIKFEKAEFESLTENLEGFLGEHNVLLITYSLKGESKTVKFFVKSKPRLQSSSQMADKLLVYEKEIFFYEKLINAFKERGYNTNFAPITFLCKDNKIMVMNDLKSEGYFLSGRTNLYDLVKIKSSLKALAYFHAASFIYEEEKSKELKRDFRLGLEYPSEFVEKFLDFVDPDSVGYQYHVSSKECFFKIIDAFEEPDDWKNDFKKRLNEVDFLEMFTKDLGVRKAIGHGDLWSNNMLFKQEDNELLCCIVDYQTMRYFNPAFDVLYLIIVNTRKELRGTYMDTFLEYYYNNLKKILKERNLSLENIYSKADYTKSIKHFKFMVRFDSACAHTLTFLDVNKLKEVLGDKSLGDVITEDRSSLVIEAYQHDPLFKEIMTENLKEMRELLIQCDAQ